MDDPHEILEFYETPRYAVVGISPIPKENIVPVFQEDIDKIRLEEVGELEMSLEETTVTEHDPYSPPIATRQPKKAKISKYMKTPLRYLNIGKNVFNIRGPLDSPVSSPSVKPWRPFLLKSPQTSPVPQNNTFSPSEMVHDTDFINTHENVVADKTENSVNKLDILNDKKTSFIDIFNKYNKDTESLENHDDSHRNVENETNSATNKLNSNNIEETHNITKELKKCVDESLPSDNVKENDINNSLNNQIIKEDPFVSEIEREINKFCNVLSGSDISSPIKILTQSAGQVNFDKVTPNKNLRFDNAKKNSDRMKQGGNVFDKPNQISDRVLQSDNVLITFNRNIENKSLNSNSFVSGDENSQSYDDLDEIFPPKKKVKIDINKTDSSRNLVNKENNPEYI